MSALFEVEPQTEPEAVKLTERHMLDLLHRRYGKVSMGARRYAVAEHVPNTTSWAARIADFIAVDCYISQDRHMPRRYEVHGHEIKVTRSDWLTELRQPEKAQAFTPYVHRWWLVVADRSIVRDGELPDGWGLLVKAGPVLRRVTTAPLREPEPMPNGMLAALLRATAKTAARPSVDGEQR